MQHIIAIRRASLALVALLALSCVLAVQGPGTPAHAQAVLGIDDASCGPSPVRAGGIVALTCQFLVTNSGDAAATEASLRMNRAPGMAPFGIFIVFDRSVDGQPVALDPITEAEFPLPPIGPGETVQIDQRLIVTAGSPGEHSFQLTLSTSEGIVEQTIVSIVVVPEAADPPANVSVTKTAIVPGVPAGGPPVPVLETARYGLTVTNVSGATLTDVRVLDRAWSSGLTFDGGDPAPTAVDDATGIVAWDVGSLAPGEVLNLEVAFGADDCVFVPNNLVMVEAMADGTTGFYADFHASNAFIIGPPECGPAPEPTPTPQPSPPPGAPVYLSLGDSVLAGCCADRSRGASMLFANYLSGALGEQVRLMNLATDSITSDDFVGSPQTWPESGRTATQLDEAVAVLEEAADDGRQTPAIALLVGGNDFLYLGDPDSGVSCRIEPTQACIELFQATLESFGQNLTLSLSRINETKDGDTPLLLLNYYNPFDTGEETPEIEFIDNVMVAINDIIAEVGAAHGAYLVDIYPLFQDRAATLISGVDPTYEGHEVIAGAMIEAYEAIEAQTPATPTPAAVATPTPVSTVEAAALPSAGDGSGGGGATPAWLIAAAVGAALTAAGFVLSATSRT
jgi:hypothetical protein